MQHCTEQLDMKGFDGHLFRIHFLVFELQCRPNLVAVADTRLHQRYLSPHNLKYRVSNYSVTICISHIGKTTTFASDALHAFLVDCISASDPKISVVLK